INVNRLVRRRAVGVIVVVKWTLWIIFGIKRTSHRQVELPQLHRLRPALLRRQAVPRLPFVVSQVVHGSYFTKRHTILIADPPGNRCAHPGAWAVMGAYIFGRRSFKRSNS